MSNNISADHPAAQAVIKQIETEHAKYVKAYKAQVARISKAERTLNRKLRKLPYKREDFKMNIPLKIH